MRLRVLAVLSAVLPLLVAPSSADAAFWRLRRTLCAESVGRIAHLTPAIPVGCELPGCCPGCSDSVALDWHLVLEGDPIGEIELGFEGLAQDELAGLKIEGQAGAMEGGRLRMGPGRSVVRGLRLQPSGRPAVATVSFAFDGAELEERVHRRPRQSSPTGELGRLRLTVEQKAGTTIVSEVSASYTVRECPRQRPRTDRIDLGENDGFDSTVVLVDGRREDGCVNDETWRGKDILYVRDLLESRQCRGEVVVFSDDDAMQVWMEPLGRAREGEEEDPAHETGEGPEAVDSSVAARDGEGDDPAQETEEGPAPVDLSVAARGWSEQVGERLSVDLAGGRRTVPLVVWTAVPEERVAAVRRRATNDVAFADMVLNRSNCGIGVATDARFMPALVDDEQIGEITRLASLVSNERSCGAVAELADDPRRYEEGALNVYYVDAPIAAWHCPTIDAVAIGAFAQPGTLSHQIGHALSLGHVSGTGAGVDFDGDGEADFSTANIMWARSKGRDGFAEGQCFRMNVNRASLLNRSNASPVIRVCPDGIADAGCPSLALDAFPD